MSNSFELQFTIFSILDASVLKQVAMISGTTAVLGLIAVLSTTMLSFGMWIKKRALFY